MKNSRIILALLVVFFLVIAAMIWHLSRLQSSLVNSSALRTAELYSVALTQFRSLYTAEVVEKARAYGLDAAHDYATRDNAIPLPATLSMLLGEAIGKHSSGASAHLYSPYPFPWRKPGTDSQLRDFHTAAWNYLSENPGKTYYRFANSGNGTVLRYATADVMGAQCVACHNGHADTPKNDWQVGDVRGVLEVSLPLDDTIAQTNASLKNTTLAYAAVGLSLVFVIGLVMIKLRQQSRELQDRVADQTRELQAEVNERRRALNAVAETEERYRSLLENAGEGIYGLDLEGKTTFVNPAVCKMLGYETDELLGRPMHALVHHSYPDGSSYPREKSPMYAAVTDGQIHRGTDEVLWRKDGSGFPVEYTSTPIHKDGRIVGAVVVFNDISERKKVERMKDEFISTVSHELRTPLTSIKGALGLVTGGVAGEIPEKAREMLDIAFENSDRLTLLVNDLLDLEKSKSGELSFHLEPLRVNDLIARALTANQGYADKCDVQLVRRPSEDDKVAVNGDEGRLLQVLSNLLSNALKYSPAGAQVQIATACHADRVRISVTDSGPGIPVEFQDRVFEKFTQADSSDTRAKGGTGLGLAISKEIVERHHGVIGFDSTPGQGATFYFELAAGAALDSGILDTGRELVTSP